MLSLLKESNLLQKLPVTLCAVTLFIVSSSALSADFTIVDGQFVTSQQTLLDPGDTGTINSGGDLTTSVIAIANRASNITVINNGTSRTDAC